MLDQQVQIEVERGGTRASVRKGVSGKEVASVVRAFKGEPDVTLIISREDNDEQLLVAVSGAKAFVALDKGPDGLFQFVVSEKHAAGKQRLVNCWARNGHWFCVCLVRRRGCERR